MGSQEVPHGEWEPFDDEDFDDDFIDEVDDEQFIAELHEAYEDDHPHGGETVESLNATIAYLVDQLFKAEASRDAYRIMMDASDERFVEQLYRTKKLEREVSELTKLITGYRWIGRPEGVGPEEPVQDMQIGGIEIDHRDE